MVAPASLLFCTVRRLSRPSTTTNPTQQFAGLQGLELSPAKFACKNFPAAVRYSMVPWAVRRLLTADDWLTQGQVTKPLWFD
jgi:hypothetical protein